MSDGQMVVGRSVPVGSYDDGRENHDLRNRLQAAEMKLEMAMQLLRRMLPDIPNHVFYDGLRQEVRQLLGTIPGGLS